MSQAPLSSPPPSGPDALARLRIQAAIVRSLLDELDERTPSLGAVQEPGLVEQLADELQRLGREVHGLAVSLAQPRPGLTPARPGLALARWDDKLEEDALPRRMTLVAL